MRQFFKRKGLLSDKEILKLRPLTGMADFQMKYRNLENESLPSCGLDSYGYDLRLSGNFRRPCGPIMKTTIGCMGEEQFCDNLPILIEPNSFILAVTVEEFRMPDDVYAIIQGKSSWARIGVVIHGCPVDPGYKGPYSLHIANVGPYPVQLYPQSGIARAIFFRGRKPRDAYHGAYMTKHHGPVTLHDIRLKGDQS